jgi:aryl-alcohol dehydrogenase-like predicted oxidoreductase
MQLRTLGKTGIKIAPMVLGGNVFGWTIDEKISDQILDAFIENGFNCIDTADVYSQWVPGHQGGESEKIIGNWIKKNANRELLIIATKVGMRKGDDDKYLSKKNILLAVENSLTRLRTEYIDLYQSHKEDVNTPIEETLEAYDILIKQGKVRAIGASNYSAHGLKAALEASAQKHLPSYECLQPQYNLYDRKDYEEHFASICKEQHLGVITYYSLAAGFLTGKYRNDQDLAISQRGSTVQKYLNERGLRILTALDKVADAFQASPAQIALAWLLAQPTVTAPITSATNLNQLKQLMDSVKIQLNQWALDELEVASRY